MAKETSEAPKTTEDFFKKCEEEILGKEINGYYFEKFLGKGGYGIVFKATKGGHQRAIKVLLQKTAQQAEEL
jgi:hypothetical protein